MDLLNSANKNGREYLGEFALKNSGLVWSIVRRFAGRGYEADAEKDTGNPVFEGN